MKTITLTNEQYALDFFSRIGCCQFEEIECMLRHFGVRQRDGDKLGGWPDFDAVARVLKELKLLYGHPSNSHWGIYHPNVSHSFKEAYNILQDLNDTNFITERLYTSQDRKMVKVETLED